MWPSHPEAKKGAIYPPLPLFFCKRRGKACSLTKSCSPRDLPIGSSRLSGEVNASNTPFFAYLAHPMPHVPLFVSEAGAGQSGDGVLGDVIAEIDRGVGQILETLQELGIDEDTLVLFTSDNGPWLSYGDHAGTTAGLREGKALLLKAAFAYRALRRWPGTIPAGRVSGVHWMTIDVLPTIAALIDAPLPEQTIDGRDATLVLLDEKSASPPRTTSAFYYHTGQLEAVRKGRWKLHLPHTYRTMQGQPQGAAESLVVTGMSRFKKRCSIWKPILMSSMDVRCTPSRCGTRTREVAEQWRTPGDTSLTDRIRGSPRRPDRSACQLRKPTRARSCHDRPRRSWFCRQVVRHPVPAGGREVLHGHQGSEDDAAIAVGRDTHGEGETADRHCSRGCGLQHQGES